MRMRTSGYLLNIEDLCHISSFILIFHIFCQKKQWSMIILDNLINLPILGSKEQILSHYLLSFPCDPF